MNFSQAYNGYNKQEVDAYIERLKAGYESKIMDEKLKTLESERRLLNLKNNEHKEKSILDALDVLEKAKQFQEDGAKNFYSLVIDKLQLLVKELNIRFPDLKHDVEFAKILKEFNEVIKEYNERIADLNTLTSPVNSPNDSMRRLLSKMQEYKKTPTKEVKITTNKVENPTTYNNYYKRNSFVFKPKEKVEQKPAEPAKTEIIAPNIPKSESGFDLQEALNPKMGLDEIMKAFDFYNNDSNKK